MLVWTGSNFSLCEHNRPRTKAAEGWLIVFIRSYCTALEGFQTELEEGKQSSVKKTDFRTRVWWAHHWRWSYGTSTQYSPWWGLVVLSAAIKCSTLPSFELFLVRELSIFITICLFLPFILFWYKHLTSRLFFPESWRITWLKQLFWLLDTGSSFVEVIIMESLRLEKILCTYIQACHGLVNWLRHVQAHLFSFLLGLQMHQL